MTPVASCRCAQENTSAAPAAFQVVDSLIRLLGSARSLLVASPGITDDLPRIDPKDWPNSAALIADFESLAKQLDTLAPEAVGLETAFSNMDAALQLPATFDHHVADMQALLADAVHILGVIDGCRRHDSGVMARISARRGRRAPPAGSAPDWLDRMLARKQ